MKRKLAIFALVLSIVVFSVPASATDSYLYAEPDSSLKLTSINYATTTLIFNGITARATTYAYGISRTTDIIIVQTLEKHWLFGIFFTEGITYTYRGLGDTVYFPNIFTTPSAGTYRMKSVVTFNYSDGTSSSLTNYSSEVTVS